MSLDQKSVRVVVFQDGEAWIAQCLEYDICAQGPDPKTVHSRFAATLLADLKESVQRGGAPFGGIEAGPEWARKMWADADDGFLAKGSVHVGNDTQLEYEMQLAA